MACQCTDIPVTDSPPFEIEDLNLKIDQSANNESCSTHQDLQLFLKAQHQVVFKILENFPGQRFPSIGQN